MKSPTTILNSIQMMKSNLKNDKQQLRIIKNNFSSLQRSVSLSQVQQSKKYQFKKQNISNILRDSINEIKTQENILQSEANLKKERFNKSRNKQNESLDKFQNQSLVLVNLKKKNQRQIRQLKQNHKKELQQIMEKNRKQIEEKQKYSILKQDQLKKQIIMLQNQLHQALEQIYQLKQEKPIENLRSENEYLKLAILDLEIKLKSKNDFFTKENQQKNQPLIQQMKYENQEKVSQNFQQEFSKQYCKNQDSNYNQCEQKINQFFQLVVKSQNLKHSQCCNTTQVKYEKIINKLIQQNSILYSKIQKLNIDNSQRQSGIRYSNVVVPSNRQQHKLNVHQSKCDSQKTQRNQQYESRGKRSIVYKISNVLANSNVSLQSKKSVKSKFNKKNIKTQANEQYYNKQNIDFSNISKKNELKDSNNSPVQDFYSKIQIESTVNLNQQQFHQFQQNSEESFSNQQNLHQLNLKSKLINKLDLSDYQILDHQSKIKTIKAFINLNAKTQPRQQQNIKSNSSLQLVKITNKKRYNKNKALTEDLTQN